MSKHVEASWSTERERINACVKACIGIEDPETTVPELCGLIEYLWMACAGIGQNVDRIAHEPGQPDTQIEEIRRIVRGLRERTLAVLAKTGKQHDPQEPQ